MNCASAIDAILEASPVELAGEGESPLAQHLRGCTRCQRLSSQLLVDTRRLAVAVRSTPALRTSNRARYAPFVPIALVASAILFGVMRAPASNESTALVPPAVPGAFVAAVPRSPASPVLPDAGTPRVASAARVSRTPRAFPKPVPVAPVRIAQVEPSSRPAALQVSRAVSVDPPPGTRATVLHTSNPKLVVVWLY